MKANNVMIDLETMSTAPNAAIIAIGAVTFNEDQVLERYYRTVNLKSSQEYGGHISADTISWWMQQSSTARLAAVNEAISLPESLQDFNTFMFAYAEPEVKAWGNGAGFDNIILRSAYTACGAIPPWRYYNDRCYRTIKSMCPHVTLERKGTAHNALDDAESQAIHLIRILKCLNLK